VREETVGSGDAAARFQRLALQKKPLTHLPGGGPAGVVSSLELRVGGVRWREVPVLFGQPPGAPVYELRTAEDGATLVQFGDGETGAQLPTGRGNVTATYRVGAGLQGRVGAGSLTTLLGKPPGLAAARNPLAAEGGADPESLDASRRNAPRTVRTFGRAVSLRDFEDLITASGEVAKASATWVWDRFDRSIHLTVAGQQGAQFSTQARRDLGAALRSARDSNHRLRIDNYRRVHLRFAAGVAVDPDRDRDAVLAAARQAVLAALSFEALELGQAVHLSDLYRVLQDVPGVVFVDVDRLQLKKPQGMSDAAFLVDLAARGATFLPGGAPAPVQGHLRVFAARPDPAAPGGVLPAELAAIQSPADDLLLEPREA
jgi:predicted phage baseplate assembly protein